MKKILVLILMVLFVLPNVTACGKTSPENDSLTGTGSPDTSGAGMTENKLSEYVVVYDASDPKAKSAAQQVVELLYSLSGALVRMQESGASVNGKKVIVGNTGNHPNLISELQKEDFFLMESGDDIVLYATSDVMYRRLIQVLRQELQSRTTDGILRLKGDLYMMYSRDVNDIITLIHSLKSDFTMVVDYGDSELKSYATTLIAEIFNKHGVLFKLKDASAEQTSGQEIVVGNCRPSAEALVSSLKEKDFVIGVSEGNLILYATDSTNYAYLKEILCREILADISKKGDLMMSAADNFIYSQSSLCNTSYKEYYTKAYGTYATRTEEYRAKSLSAADKEDQDLIDAMVKRLADGFSVKPGMTCALYDGYVVKLDTGDYQKAAFVSEGNLWIPDAFARKYFGGDIVSGNDGYFNVSAYVQEHNDRYMLYHNAETGIYVVSSKSSIAFGDNVQVGGYSDRQLLQRMNDFLDDRYEPTNSTEQSRVLIHALKQDAENSVNWKAEHYQSLHDPSLATAYDENGNLVLYAAYYWLDWKNGVSTSKDTVLFASYDEGATWKQVATTPMHVATVFELNGYIYLLGISNQKLLQVAQYNPRKNLIRNVTVNITVGGGGPGTVLIYNDRVYKCCNLCVVSAPVDSDLLNPESWTASTPLNDILSPAWKKEVGVLDTNITASYVEWEEGSVIPGKDGKLYVVYRQNKTVGYAAVLQLSEDGTTLSYINECNGKSLIAKSLITVPSAITRHSIRYDEQTGLYISFMNLPTLVEDGRAMDGVTRAQRTVLALTVSEDLVNWRVVDTVLVDRQIMNPYLASFAHGYQYVDFRIVGDKIYFVVRETTGYTVSNFHEAPYLTFYTMENYRELIASEGN